MGIPESKKVMLARQTEGKKISILKSEGLRVNNCPCTPEPGLDNLLQWDWGAFGKIKQQDLTLIGRGSKKKTG